MSNSRNRLRGLAARVGIVFASLIFGMSNSFAEEDLARTLVEKADEIRFPKGSFEMEILVTSSKPDEDKEVRRYRVLSQGNEKSIVQVTEPASERGQNLLMKGRDLWLYVPEVSQPVRLSFSQRLTGQVSNGDIARANFSGDYDPRLLYTEMRDGIECYALELTATERSVTYAKVMLWVRKLNNYPQRAEFYSVSGRLLKSATYENFQTLLGRVRPTRMVLKDAVKKGEESVMDYSNMKLRDLPDRMFTKEYLRKLD